MDFTKILEKYSLDMGEVAFIAALVTFSTALLKKHFGLAGNWILAGAVACTGVWVSIYYLNVPTPVVVGMLVLVLSAGGWQTVKDAGKKFNEPPSQLTDVKPGP
jgi:hypothetical protein